MAWERMLRVGRQIPHPFAQHILMEVEIPRRLGDRHTPLLDQPHCLKLELATELPSLHWKTPVPSSTPYLGVQGTGSRPVGCFGQNATLYLSRTLASANE